MYDTLDEVCGFLNNWFLTPDGIHVGDYTAEGGKLALPFLTDGQYYRVIIPFSQSSAARSGWRSYQVRQDNSKG